LGMYHGDATLVTKQESRSVASLFAVVS
jgi:hypothetical protein